MFGIRFVKAPPTTYVMRYSGGQLRQEGAGLTFFCFGPFSEIVLVPIGSTDVPFIFQEVTGDFQEATIQGQLTYRIQDPRRVASLLDFSVNAWGQYRSEDPGKLSDRLIHATQILTRAFTQQHPLRDVLVASDRLVNDVLGQLKKSEPVTMLGLEILSLSITSISATPEMAKALQAEAREQLLRRADEAVFERRNMAVELERRIKENELNTEIAVEQKRRTVRETQMQAEIAVERQRAELVDQKVENERKEAAARAETLRATLDPLKSVDWRTLLAASAGAANPKTMIALAFRDLADNAQKLGTVNITPDLLSALLDDQHTPQRGSKG